MCLPLSLLKIWVGIIAGLINIGIGVALIVISQQVNNFYEDQINDLGSDVVKTRNIFAVGLLALGIIILVTGIFAFIGGLKKIRCLIIIYVIFAFCIFIIFLALSIVGGMTES